MVGTPWVFARGVKNLLSPTMHRPDADKTPDDASSSRPGKERSRRRLDADAGRDASDRSSASEDSHSNVLNDITFLDRTTSMRQRDQSKRDPAVDEEDEDGELTTEALAARERRYERRWYSIDPEGSFRSNWDLAQAIILAYIALTVPFRVGLKQPAEGGWYVLDLIIDLYFYVDVVLNFVTGFEESEPDEAIDGSLDDAGRVVYDPAAIAKHYARTWLLIDVVACLPIDIVIRVSEDRFVCSMSSGGCPTAEIGEEDDSSGQLLRMFKMLRLFRLMKLLRLVKIMRLMERYQDDLFKYIAYLSVVKLVMIMLYVGHLFACFFHYFSVDDWRTSEENAQIADGTLTPWLREYFDDADPTAKDVVDRYIASMYWAFTTMTTVGYGDISAVTRVERVIAIFGMIIGGFVFSAIIGTMAEVMGKTDLSRKAHSHKMESVAAFIRDENLPKSMFKEALAFFRRQTVEGYDRASLLRELPFELRKKIMYHSFADVIELAPLFDVAPDVGVDATVFVTELCSRLRPATYSPSELVYASGEIGSTMFILRKGQIEVLDDAPGGGAAHNGEKESAVVLATLDPGAYFGEGCVLGDRRRRENMRAKGVVEVCALSAQDAEAMLEFYPHLDRKITGAFRRRRQLFERFRAARVAEPDLKLREFVRRNLPDGDAPSSRPGSPRFERAGSSLGSETIEKSASAASAAGRLAGGWAGIAAKTTKDLRGAAEEIKFAANSSGSTRPGLKARTPDPTLALADAEVEAAGGGGGGGGGEGGAAAAAAGRTLPAAAASVRRSATQALMGRRVAEMAERQAALERKVEETLEAVKRLETLLAERR